MEKMTKVEKFEVVVNALMTGEVDEKMSVEEMVEFLRNEQDLLTRKKASAKPSAKQVENANIKALLYEVMSADTARMFAISDLIAAHEAFASLTNQRVSALLSQLVKEDKVAKTYDKKGKVYFFALTAADVE